MTEQRETPSTLKLVPLQTALQIIAKSLSGRRPEVELVEVSLSVGRVSAEDVLAPHDIPLRDKAALDGIAVRSSDVSNASLKTPVRLMLREGHAVLIATGDEVPEWADAVIKRENVKLLNGYAEVYEPIEPGKNIFKRGEDVKEGETIVRRGERIKPEQVALLEEFDIDSVKVFRKPKVGIVAVGDELYEGYRERGIKAINYAHLASMKVAEMGCVIERLTAAPDDVRALADIISELARSCDAVITVGGSSIGHNDTVHRAVESIRDSEVLFHGLRYNPAKTSGYAVVMGKPLLMLPGHVVSMVGALYLLGEPLLSTLIGLESAIRVIVRARCASSQKFKKGMGNLVLVKIRRESTELLAEPLGWGTNYFKKLLEADGYVLVEDGDLEEGEEIDVYLTS